MLYQSIKLTNGIWVLTELKVQPGNTTVVVSSIDLLTQKPVFMFQSVPIVSTISYLGIPRSGEWYTCLVS